MNDGNPMVGDTAQNTLNNMIETLGLLSTILTMQPPEDADEPVQFALKTDDIAGLKHMVEGVKGAAETCFAQCANAHDQEDIEPDAGAQ